MQLLDLFGPIVLGLLTAAAAWLGVFAVRSYDFVVAQCVGLEI